MEGKYISRVCVIHMTKQKETTTCLYDRIWPGDEKLWMRDEKEDDDEEDNLYKFAVSGTEKERLMRQELIDLISTLFMISRSIDGGSLFKAAFQKPAEVRQNNFTVKFTPHFGTLARPKKNINTKISSMVFGQAQTEMVIASKKMAYKTRKEQKNDKKNGKMNGNSEEKKEDKSEDKAYGEFVCAVFYGVHCKPDTASTLAKKLIDEFFIRFPSELQKLLIRLDRERADIDDESTLEDEVSEFGMSFDSDSVQIRQKEYIMAQFKSFDEIAVRLQTRHIDRRERRISNRRLHTKRKHKVYDDDENESKELDDY